MPVFQCVQCCDCSRFQSAQVRKDKKFSCKICGKKQSVRKVFAASTSGAEVRKVVQRLNLARGQAQEAFEDQRAAQCRDESDYPDEYGEPAEEAPEESCLVDPSQSRWRDLARAADIAEGKYEHPLAKTEDNLEDDFEIVTALPDRHVYSNRRGRKHRASGSRRNGGGAGSIPATGGIKKNDSRQKAKTSFVPSSRSEPRQSLPEQSHPRNKEAAQPLEVLSNDVGNDAELFTTAPADIPFEDEVFL